jgi:hypothetical protein
MSGEHQDTHDNQSGGAVATSEDITVSKRGINGDKDTLLDMNGTIHQRKTTVSNSDPETGIIQNEGHNQHHNPVLDNEGINVDSFIMDGMNKSTLTK